MPFAELTFPPPFPKTTNPLPRWKDPHKDYLHSDSISNRIVPLLYACILSATTCCWPHRIRLRWPWTQHHPPFATRYRRLWTEIEISTEETYNFYNYQTMTRLVMQDGTHHLLLWHVFTYLYYTNLLYKVAGYICRPCRSLPYRTNSCTKPAHYHRREHDHFRIPNSTIISSINLAGSTTDGLRNNYGCSERQYSDPYETSYICPWYMMAVQATLKSFSERLQGLDRMYHHN